MKIWDSKFPGTLWVTPGLLFFLHYLCKRIILPYLLSDWQQYKRHARHPDIPQVNAVFWFWPVLHVDTVDVIC